MMLLGTDDFSGSTYKIFVKNENIIGWLDGELDAMSPDYIYNLDPNTGESITSDAWHWFLSYWKKINSN